MNWTETRKQEWIHTWLGLSAIQLSEGSLYLVWTLRLMVMAPSGAGIMPTGGGGAGGVNLEGGGGGGGGVTWGGGGGGGAEVLLHELVDDVEQDERALLTPARTRRHQLCTRREYQIKQIIRNILKIGKCDIYVLRGNNYFSCYY